MAIRVEKRETSLRSGRQKANAKNRILITGRHKPRLVSFPSTVFQPNRSKLVTNCTKCGKSFNVVERKIVYGKNRIKRTNQCIDCWKLHSVKNNQYRRAKWCYFKQLYIEKVSGGCERCGYSDYRYLSVFVFHHKNSKEKEGCVSTIIGSGYNLSNKKLFVKEARKCMVLCKNCHAIIHEKGGVLSL